MFTVYEFVNTRFDRQTFVFYNIIDDSETVEDRMLPHSFYREINARDIYIEELELRRYVEEALLGPISPECAPLFSRDTRLRSLLYRNGVVYVDLSESAVLPPMEGIPLRDGTLRRNLQTLENGIKRNFSTAKEVKLFINGYKVDAVHS